MLLTENISTNQGQITKDGILHIDPSKEIVFSKIYLNESQSSWITIEWLSEELIEYSTTNYQTLFNLHPLQRGKVFMFDEEVDSSRWHRSYLHQPKLDIERKHSYMYSGIEPYEDLTLPIQFQKFLAFLNEKESKNKYNQVIVNWYANGLDYIAPHSDCQLGMITNAEITIITLCENEKFPRELVISPKNLENETNANLYNHLKIKLKHGCIITMHGETQKYFRHKIPKVLNNYTSRIGLTFRKFL